MKNSKYIDWDVKEMQLQLLRVKAKIDSLEQLVHSNYTDGVKKSTFYDNKNKLKVELIEEEIIKNIISMKKQMKKKGGK